MQFSASTVSASVAGDYYQLYLGPEETEKEGSDPYAVEGLYLIVQRQFEMPDGGRCYIETHDERHIGHFRLRLTELSQKRLVFETMRKSNDHVEVSFVLNAIEFEEVRRVTNIVFRVRELDPMDDDGAL